MAKADTIAAIKTANGQDLDVNDYSQKQLDTLLPLAQKGEAGLTEFGTQRKAYDDERAAFVDSEDAAPTPAPKAPLKRPITVQVAPGIAAYGGEFTDPDSQSTIGKDPVTVEYTPFVVARIRANEIVEVTEG